MLLLYANFLVEVRKDGQSARTQLQLAVKHNPTIIERYFIYVTGELVKGLKAEGAGMDLLGYVEFQRNYRYAERRQPTSDFLQMILLLLRTRMVTNIKHCPSSITSATVQKA